MFNYKEAKKEHERQEITRNMWKTILTISTNDKFIKGFEGDYQYMSGELKTCIPKKFRKTADLNKYKPYRVFKSICGGEKLSNWSKAVHNLSLCASYKCR